MNEKKLLKKLINNKNLKIIKLIIILLIFFLVLILIEWMKFNVGEKEYFYGILTEERFENGILKDKATYNYNSKFVTSTNEKLYCNDSKSCGYKENYDIGLYGYKYQFIGYRLNKMMQRDMYSESYYEIHFNNNGNIKYKRPAFSLGYTEPNVFEHAEYVNYKYDNTNRLISKITTSPLNKKVKLVDTEYTYENNLLKTETTKLEHGSIYKKTYDYDSNNNVIKCVINYNFKEEDNIIVNADTLLGDSDYKGTVILKYNYKYKENLIQSSNLKVYVNNNLTYEYDTIYKYDKNNNLIYEKVNIDENIYERKLKYKKIQCTKNSIEYMKKINKIQTNSTYIPEYYLVDSNWLDMLFLDI